MAKKEENNRLMTSCLQPCEWGRLTSSVNTFKALGSKTASNSLQQLAVGTGFRRTDFTSHPTKPKSWLESFLHSWAFHNAGLGFFFCPLFTQSFICLTRKFEIRWMYLHDLKLEAGHANHVRQSDWKYYHIDISSFFTWNPENFSQCRLTHQLQHSCW